MPNNIAFARNYTAVIDEVYQRASISVVLNSGRRMVRAGHNAKEILIPKIEFHMNHRVKGDIKVAAIVFSTEFGVLGQTPSADELLAKVGAKE